MTDAESSFRLHSLRTGTPACVQQRKDAGDSRQSKQLPSPELDRHHDQLHHSLVEAEDTFSTVDSSAMRMQVQASACTA